MKDLGEISFVLGIKIQRYLMRILKLAKYRLKAQVEKDKVPEWRRMKAQVEKDEGPEAMHNNLEATVDDFMSERK